MVLEQTRFTVLGLNPNDVATFIVVLILSLPILLKWSNRWAWFLWPAETILIALLIGSGSRGGVLALICGSIVALVLSWRMGSSPKGWKIWTSIALVIILGVAAGLAAFPKGFRLGNMDVSSETSVGRRLEVWSAVPAMLASAPGGWGFGNAAEAYEQWFEPVGENVELKHLLSSHLTWLVEFGWPLRWLYAFLWISALVLLVPDRKFTFPFWGVAVWTALLVAIFYNAAGKWWNWPLPVIWLAAALFLHCRGKTFPRRRYAVIAMLLSGLFVACPFAIPSPALSIQAWHDGNIVVINSGKPAVAILAPSKDVLGKFYGQEIRRNAPAQVSIVIVNKADTLAASHLADCPVYVVSGGNETVLDQWASILKPKSDSTLILINCRVRPNDWIKGFGHVVYCHGDFYGDPHYGEWKELAGTNPAVSVKDVPRHEAYIADWWPLLDEAVGK